VARSSLSRLENIDLKVRCWLTKTHHSSGLRIISQATKLTTVIQGWKMNKSRIPIYGMVHRFGISRFLKQMVGGRLKSDGETEIVVYQSIPGRADNLRSLVENKDEKTPYGDHSGKVRRFKLSPLKIPNKLRQGDFVKVGWGTKPNLLAPLSAPVWGAPSLCLKNPGGDSVILHWYDELLEYASETLFLRFDESWKLSGDVTHTFTTTADFDDNPLCRSFPSGWSFNKLSGPDIFYKITEFNHQLDDFGMYHHTSLECELEDKDGKCPV